MLIDDDVTFTLGAPTGTTSSSSPVQLPLTLSGLELTDAAVGTGVGTGLGKEVVSELDSEEVRPGAGTRGRRRSNPAAHETPTQDYDAKHIFDPDYLRNHIFEPQDNTAATSESATSSVLTQY